MANKKTLVLGASENPERYSNLAVRKLEAKGHEVIAIGQRSGTIGSVSIETATKDIESLDTVTLYLSAANQKPYYDYIISQYPKRIIFNPGAENEELVFLAEKNNIHTQEACTLVLLTTGQY